MTGAVTYEQLGWFIAQIVAIAGLVALVWGKVAARIAAAEERALAVSKELASYKLEVANDYARNGYIKDVEGRLIGQIKNVAEEIHKLREAIEKLMMAATREVRDP